MSLNNKVAIITGAARGIGYAIARRFVEDGAKVVLSDIDDVTGEAAAEELSALGEAIYVHCDVGERLDVRNLLAATLDTYGDIDILVNNAGIVSGADFLEIDEAEFDRVLKVNLKGTFLCAQAVARHMAEKVDNGGEPGVIINMSSVNAVFGLPNQVPYSVSKGGVSQLTKVMAISLAPRGIRSDSWLLGLAPSSFSHRRPLAKCRLMDGRGRRI